MGSGAGGIKGVFGWEVERGNKRSLRGRRWRNLTFVSVSFPEKQKGEIAELNFIDSSYVIVLQYTVFLFSGVWLGAC